MEKTPDVALSFYPRVIFIGSNPARLVRSSTAAAKTPNDSKLALVGDAWAGR